MDPVHHLALLARDALSGVDAPTADGITATSDVSLTYATADAYAARVSADVEALRSLPGFALAESWSDAPLVVCLRYVAAPVEAPRPIAPAPVPATSSRRR